ncbi:recombinase family protein [Tamlana sp. 2201CG12-4]|uniref:recombinase family protein n=1 Tax=Tamlana sp. 2201CG12-4 TaxID=3112582 RepID=UPI002DB814B1|nr:recombinase family protein [Tamlana sp. 2201CG12-4]MEC3906125.1 recombinase family protein [Tamlana sp. 2201CG12-4]
MTAVAIFGRVSRKDKQDYKRQITDMQNVAKRKNYEVVSIIAEKISGAKKNEERLGIQQLLSEAKAGKFQKILVTEVSRLGRNTLETLKLVEQLHEMGINIYLHDLGTDTLNEEGEMNMTTEIMLHMLSLFAKNERKTTIDRIKSGMAQAKANGTHIGRYKGTTEDKTQFLKKYQKVVDALKRGLSIRECVKVHGFSLGTVAKVRKYIKDDLELLEAA